MVTKEFEMFYFDDKTFICLCKQLEAELKMLDDYSGENAHDLRLVYQKFELFLTVYYRSRKREDIDYKLPTRLEIAEEINLSTESESSSEINSDYYRDNFLNAKEKLERVMEDLIYQIIMKNLSISA